MTIHQAERILKFLSTAITVENPMPLPLLEIIECELENFEELALEMEDYDRARKLSALVAQLSDLRTKPHLFPFVDVTPEDI